MYRIIAVVFAFAFSLPLMASAAGPTVVVDLAFHSVELQQGSDRIIIEFSENVKDLQAVRLERAGQYYLLVLRWKGDVARINLYNAAGEKLGSRKVFKAKGEKDLTVLRTTVVAANNEEIVQIDAVKTNDAGQPIKILRKQFAVNPGADSQLPKRNSTETAIAYPDLTGLSDPDAGLAVLNYQRTAAGLLPFTRSGTLDAKCSLHAEYMRLNDELTHYEEEGLPGYTDDGAEAGGASDITKQTSGSMVDSVDILMKAIYHRLQILDNYVQIVGYAISGKSASGFRYGCLYLDNKPDTTGQLAGNETNITYSDPGNHAPLFSPGVNQVEVTPIFDTGEDPDPLAPFGGDLPAGYPIAVMFPATHTITNVSMELLHPNGQPIAGYFRAPDDPNDPNLIYQLNNATFIPEAPLAGNTTYTVNVAADYNDQHFSKQWQFTTE